MILTLAMLAAGLSPATPSRPSAPPDVVEDIIERAAEDWRGIESVPLSQNPYRDKRLLCRDLDKVAPKAPAEDRAAAAAALLKGLSDTAPADLVWRTHELRSRLLAPEPKAARAALTEAIVAYPVCDYPSPMRHSYFQHLVNARAEWALKDVGAKAATTEILDQLRTDPRYSYFYSDPLLSAFMEARAFTELRELFAGAAGILEERDPEAAAALRAQPVPEVLELEGDPKKLYVLIGGEPLPGRPRGKESRPLVVVMPGGSGQALEFLPWLMRLTGPLLGDYRFAVLSAPVWQEGQGENVVWTTKRYRKKYKAKFTVEEFAREVAQEHGAKGAGAYLFAWSSGGPAAYATVLDRDKTFRGAYIHSSVFWRNQLDVKRAKGKRFVLEQGRKDEVTAFHHAEEAKEVLEERGAAVKFMPSDGGHGFTHPEAGARLGEALGWLTAED